MRGPSQTNSGTSTSLAAAAVNGAKINERLTGLAVKRLGTITEDSSPEDLKPIRP